MARKMPTAEEHIKDLQGQVAALESECESLRDEVNALEEAAEAGRSQSDMIDDFLALDLFTRRDYLDRLGREAARIGVAK